MWNKVLEFWFEDIQPAQWFRKDAEFDALLQQRFGQTLKAAAAAELSVWRQCSRGRLAEIIVLDQFTRNIHRDTPQAFANDAMALVLSQEAILHGALNDLSERERGFLLMPYMHSESPVIHAEAEMLFRDYTPQGHYDSELRHKAIIDRFGRYPHRNAILGRESSDEELAFLQQPGSGF